MRGRTTIVISHRRDLARRADRVVVLDGARIVEQGTARELILRDGPFTALFGASRWRRRIWISLPTDATGFGIASRDAAVTSWQRANIQAAASYMRERISQGATDVKTKAIYDGLLEVLDPTRRATRIQREMATAARAAVTVKAAPTPGRGRAPPAGRWRRVNLGNPTGAERRRIDRRTGRDRRHRG